MEYFLNIVVAGHYRLFLASSALHLPKAIDSKLQKSSRLEAQSPADIGMGGARRTALVSPSLFYEPSGFSANTLLTPC